MVVGGAHPDQTLLEGAGIGGGDGGMFPLRTVVCGCDEAHCRSVGHIGPVSVRDVPRCRAPESRRRAEAFDWRHAGLLP